MSSRHRSSSSTTRPPGSGARTRRNREALARAYTRRIVRSATLPDGATVERTLTVVANPVFGYPTDLAQRLFHVLVGRWEAQGRPDDPSVYVTRADLCRDLGVKVSGRELGRIEHQLRALKAVSIEFSDAWYAKEDPRQRGTWAPGKKTVTVIADWCFAAEPLGGGPRRACRGYPGAAWVKLGEAIHASLRGRYLQPLDLAYFLGLDAVSRRLYVYLSKRGGRDKATYAERLALLRERLPLDGDRPSRVVGPLKRALDRLTAPLDLDGRQVRFLEGYQWPFDGDGWDQVVRVWFHSRGHLDALRKLKARIAAGGGEGLPPAVARDSAEDIGTEGEAVP